MLNRFKHSDELEVAIIGGGVVGLAIGRELAIKGKEVVIFEANASTGKETSSHGSGVIHRGIYYKPGSLKAQLCVRGHQLTTEYAMNHQVGKDTIHYKKVGKLIVATTETEEYKLEELKTRAEQNGVHDLEWMTSGEVQNLEPDVRAARALYSPNTAIVDPHELMESFKRDLIETHNGFVKVDSPVIGGEVQNEGIVLDVGGKTRSKILCHTVINCAGLRASHVARSIKGIAEETIPETYYSTGHYYALRIPSPFSHLVYPVPVPGGLGTHATLERAKADGSRGIRFGPDVTREENFNFEHRYGFDDSPERRDAFYRAIRRYWPDLPDNALVPAYTGVRPTAQPGEKDPDFKILGPDVHNVPGYYGLYHIESPGLTSALAIAHYVMALIHTQ